MQGASALDPQSPEGGEGPELPLKALAEGFEMPLADVGILWVFVRVGQRHEDHPPFEGPEGVSVDACETSEEVPAACPREALYPVSVPSTATPTREPVE